MNPSTISWVKTHESGPKKAIPVLPDAASRILKRAKRPVIVIGSAINDVDGILDRVIKLQKLGIGIVATGHSIKFLLEKGTDAFQAGVTEVTNLLTDTDWKGPDGRGLPDLVMILGVHLDLTNQTFSTLKNFTDIESMCIDRYFMPNATYTFPNTTEDIWIEYLDELIKKCE
ncbi:MAG: CO dehydrogenase/acetyl-CoA synthase complex subunit epsilon [Candidatus Hydrothermarchaeaceae archaeon]